MSQLTYNFNPATGTAGMVAESREANVIISKVAHLLVPVGLLGAPGPDGEIGMQPNSADPNSTNPGQIIALPAGIVPDPIPDSTWIGIPIYDSSRPPYTSLNQYADMEYVPVLRKGVIWVTSENAVTQYADVYVRVAPNGPNVTLGVFSSGVGPGKVLFPRGRWMTTNSGAGLAILEVW